MMGLPTRSEATHAPPQSSRHPQACWSTNSPRGRASALGRLGRALDAALAALADAMRPLPRTRRRPPNTVSGAHRWWRRRASRSRRFVVQREACGLRDMRYVLRDYRVPPEVAARMGVLPAEPAGTRKRSRGTGEALRQDLADRSVPSSPTALGPLVPLHSDFDRLNRGQSSSGRCFGSTSSSMLRATFGCLRMKPARSRVNTIW